MLRNCVECGAEFDAKTCGTLCGTECRQKRRKRLAAERGQAWYETNKERRLEKSKAWYETNKERKLEINQTWREANKERIAETGRFYRQANKERITKSSRVYYQTNKERIAETKRAYRQANKERIAESSRVWREANKEKYVKWCEENKERVAENARKWKKANKDRVRLLHERRRARQLFAPGDDVSVEDWAVILELAEHRCSYCNAEVGSTPGTVHLEHVIPLSRGGWHDPSNVVPACPTCNLRKGAKTPTEWMPEWVAPFWVVLREPDLVA